jgi:hypothetical protein
MQLLVQTVTVSQHNQLTFVELLKHRRYDLADFTEEDLRRGRHMVNGFHDGEQGEGEEGKLQSPAWKVGDMKV